MGLDWNPGPKPKPEHEQEFRELWRKLHAKSCFLPSRKAKRLQQITITAFETLAIPRVGFDLGADQWALQKLFPNRPDKSLTEESFLKSIIGMPVASLGGLFSHHLLIADSQRYGRNTSLLWRQNLCWLVA
jgi:hypothetical protein